MTTVGSRPPLWKIEAIIDVVDVLPCAPATATPYFIRISSASISARRMIGICSWRAAATSGLSSPTAEETTTTWVPAMLSARCPA